jgi:hypothetical protein
MGESAVESKRSWAVKAAEGHPDLQVASLAELTALSDQK